ncbi:MAG: HD domain-containing protein [Actinobacteria bacterium]|nr:HD domain-containing protein [Actinomycetota bacterium]
MKQQSGKQAGIQYQLFVLIIVAAAVGSLSFLLITRHGELNSTSLPIIALLSGLAIIAGEMAVEFSPRVIISVTTLPVLLAIVFIGPIGAAIVAGCSSAWVTRKWPGVAILFNVSSALLEVFISAELFIYLRNLVSASATYVSFALLSVAAISAIFLVLVNFIIGSFLFRVKYHQNLKKTWKQYSLPALPSQLILIGIGLAILSVYVKAGPIATALFFVPIFAGQHVFKLLLRQKELLVEQTKLSQELMDMNIGLAGALIMLLDSKDHYTASHSAGVAMYCRDMANMMGMGDDQQRIAHMAGLLHDLGKVGTPDSVLKKKGKLTPEEWEQVKQHPTTAAEALSQLASHKEIADIIRHHQERFDGSGYPYGKKGDEIPELSRMLAVADTYHALTSTRPYRKAKSPFEALIILRRVAGTQLDPKYVEVMAQVLKNEDLSYREGSKADFLEEFQKDRPARRLDAFLKHAKEV